MGSTGRLVLRTLGAAAIALGGVAVVLAIALVTSVWSVDMRCPDGGEGCNEGRPLSVVVATPVVLGGIVLATIGWLVLKVLRKN